MTRSVTVLGLLGACACAAPSEPEPGPADGGCPDAGSIFPCDRLPGGPDAGREPGCDDYCAAMETACPGAYPSAAACATACARFPVVAVVGGEAATTGNSLQCRLHHAALAASDGSHCAAAGEVGGGVCGDGCDHHCSLAVAACGARRSECVAACRGWPTHGLEGDEDGDTFQCRQTHVAAAATDATRCDAMTARCACGADVEPNDAPGTAVSLGEACEERSLAGGLNGPDVDHVQFVPGAACAAQPASADVGRAAVSLCLLATCGGARATPTCVEGAASTGSDGRDECCAVAGRVVLDPGCAEGVAPSFVARLAHAEAHACVTYDLKVAPSGD